MNRRAKPNRFSIPGILLMLLGVACFSASAFLFLQPPEFLATARIRLVHDELAIVAKEPGSFELDANETDVELLQAETVLSKVIEQFDLATKWGNGSKLSPSAALGHLKDHLKVQSSPGTPFINVSVLDRDRDQAAQIANAIGEIYIVHRRDGAVELARNAVRSFTELRNDVRQQIDSAEREANTMKTNLHLALLSTEAQLKVPIYREMRDQMANLTNALQSVEQKLAIAERFQEHPPVAAELTDRATPPTFPVKRSAVVPGSLASAGGFLFLLGTFFCIRRFRA